MMKLTKTPILPNYQVPDGFFLGITVNFIVQKLKSKHLVCLSFLWRQVFFEGTRENILHIGIPGLSAQAEIFQSIFLLFLGSLRNHSFLLKLFDL